MHELARQDDKYREIGKHIDGRKKNVQLTKKSRGLRYRDLSKQIGQFLQRAQPIELLIKPREPSPVQGKILYCRSGHSLK
jgi:hypothetical protein